jgi:hypothetical protein
MDFVDSATERRFFVMMTINGVECDSFMLGFIECLLWSCTDEEGQGLDRQYDKEDIGKGSLEEIKQDCDDFQESQSELLEGLDDDFAGHNFCLTRNGHGAGFWDCGLGELGDQLTAACRPYGSLYLSEDGEGGLCHHG